MKSIEEMDHTIVNVEILEFPERGGPAVGRVIEILGRQDDFGIDIARPGLAGIRTSYDHTETGTLHCH